MDKVVNCVNDWLNGGDADGGLKRAEVKRAIEERVKEVGSGGGGVAKKRRRLE